LESLRKVGWFDVDLGSENISEKEDVRTSGISLSEPEVKFGA